MKLKKRKIRKNIVMGGIPEIKMINIMKLYGQWGLPWWLRW